MRASITATLLIIAVAAGLGWYNSRQLADMEMTRHTLAQEAAELGIPDDADPARPTKRKRFARAAVPKLSSAELIALAEAVRDAPGDENYLRLLDSLSVLGAEDLENFLAEIGADTRFGSVPGRMFVSEGIGVLARNHPRAALELFVRNPKLIDNWWSRMSYVRTALVSLVPSDPASAIEWIGKYPELVTAEEKRAMISAVAPQDPLLAFRLVGDLKFERAASGVQEIVGSAGTLEVKSAVLAGLREYLAGIPDDSTRNDELRTCFRMLSQHLEREDFNSATRWIADANFNALELEPFLDGFITVTVGVETGHWIEWMRQTPPSEPTDSRISNLIHQWVQNDYRSAATWAATQPPGKDRDSIWKIINDQWPAHDSRGKAAFMKEHGIE